MTAAIIANDFHAPSIGIGQMLNGIRNFIVEGRPTAAAVEFRFGRVKRRIATAAEKAPVARGLGLDRLQPGEATVEETIASASVTAVRLLGANTIVVFTKSGFSARIVAARRPGVRIVVLTDNPRTYRQLALVWGVVPFLVPHCNTYLEMAQTARELLLRNELAKPGDRVVITAGVPFDVPGTTNQLKVETV